MRTEHIGTILVLDKFYENDNIYIWLRYEFLSEYFTKFSYTN